MTFLLIAQLAFSQNGYPKRIKIGKDSLVAITNSQAKEWHKLIIKYENIKYDSAVMSIMLNNCSVMLKQKESEIDNYDHIIGNFRGEINLYKEKEKMYDKKVEQLFKANKRNKNIVIGSLSVNVVLLLLLVVK